jgi:aspartyl-tRNA synthetase
VFIRDLEVLGAAEELPLMVFGEQEYPEETRLKYRYLDLRREKLQKNMKMRSDVVASMRRRMWDQGFREFQTPIITASSPEGARDFLVPSRLHPGKFYALPQAPQQFKQLIMVSGYDKYFQIAPCFRDEDPRADRSPTDFYQLDLEMSFVDQQDIFDTIQPVLTGVFEEFGGGRKVDQTWEQISYRDAALWYGSDKPDLRNPIKMQVVSEHFAGSGFAIFAKLLEQEGTEIRAIPAPKGGSRKFCDRMNAFAQKEGLPGMGYIFWRDQGEGMEAAGPLAKNIGPERTEAIRQQLGLGVGDAAFFLGGKPKAFEGVAGKARMVIGDELGLTDKDRFAFAWIVDFRSMRRTKKPARLILSTIPSQCRKAGWRRSRAILCKCWAINMIWPVTAMSCSVVRFGITAQRSCSKPLRLLAMARKRWKSGLVAWSMPSNTARRPTVVVRPVLTGL